MYFTRTKSKGFTLVELLVVISIIVLLSSFAVVTIKYYRDKAKDARLEASLSQIRSIAAMLYTDTHSYETLCKEDGTLNTEGEGDVYQQIKVIKSEIEKFNENEDIVCYSNENSFCVSSPAKTVEGFCVDSTGYVGDSLTACDESNSICH